MSQGQIFMNLGPQMPTIRVDNRKGVIFNTGPYVKNKNVKIVFYYFPS